MRTISGDFLGCEGGVLHGCGELDVCTIQNLTMKLDSLSQGMEVFTHPEWKEDP